MLSPQGRFFCSRCHCEPVRTPAWQSVLFSKDRLTCFYKSWIKRNAPPRVPPRVKLRGTTKYAGMMELADMQDLGSCAAMRWGSNPHARTTKERTFVYQGKVRSFFIFWGKNTLTVRNTGKKRLNRASERPKRLHRRSICVCGAGFGWHTKVRCLPR